MEWIAHRGAAFAAPENSLAAFEAAIDEGCDRIELDVQVTRDGVAVISHDATTEREGDRKVEIEFATADEVQSVRLRNGEPVPTFEQACEVIGDRAALDVELKSITDQTARQVLNALRAHGVEDDALVTSFDAPVLRRMKSMGFRGRLGLLVGSKSMNVRQRAYEAWPLAGIDTAAATDLVIHHMLAHKVLRRALDRRGLGLVLWTAVEDETKSEAARAALYRRLVKMDPVGAIVARIAEARSVTAAPGL